MKFSGHTISGAGRGRKIGFPTLNIQLDEGVQHALPNYAEGVFAVRGTIEEASFEGIAHLGPRPTFADADVSIEIHVFDFCEEIKSGTRIQFETVGKKIRGVRKFTLEEKLKEQIARDIERAKEILARHENQ